MLRAGSQSYDSSGRFHSAHFFELADQPLEVVMNEAVADELLATLQQEDISVFYVKSAIGFGMLGVQADSRCTQRE